MTTFDSFRETLLKTFQTCNIDFVLELYQIFDKNTSEFLEPFDPTLRNGEHGLHHRARSRDPWTSSMSQQNWFVETCYQKMWPEQALLSDFDQNVNNSATKARNKR